MSKTVVDNICVFKTDDERLTEVQFDNATQICCEKVHEKMQNGKEIECCGGSKFFQYVESNVEMHLVLYIIKFAFLK